MSQADHTNTEDESNDELAKRVETLEEKVDEQLELEASDGKTLSIDRLLNLGLTRRQSFAALGYVAIGMSSVGAIAKAIGNVQAQSEPDAIYGLDQIGTEDQPVTDLYVENLNSNTTTDTITADLVSAGDIDLTNAPPDGRDIISTGSVNVTVDVTGGADYTSIQTALDDIPYFVAHPYEIHVNNGDYTSEGTLIVPPHVCSYIDRDGDTGNASIDIVGNTSTPTNVNTGAWILDHAQGYRTKVSGFNVTAPDTPTDEDSAFSAYGCGRVAVGNLTVTDGTFSNTIVAYASHVEFAGVTFDASATVEHGFVTKHQGKMMAQATARVDGGNVGGYLFYSSPGGGPISIQGDSNISITGDSGLVSADGQWVEIGGKYTIQDMVSLPLQDLTSSSAPEPDDFETLAMHNGGGGVANGLYRSNPDNSQWVKVEDNSVTISY